MPSSIAWLDTSADEQRSVRDIIALFTQHESRDELGLGTIRDALSNRLFPGTSVLQTRARYFLIVPWCFQHAARGGPAKNLSARVEKIERRLVEELRRGSDEGVIGKTAGARVKNLPSVLFWSGLTTYGIVDRPTGMDQLTGIATRIMGDDAVSELVERQRGEWHPTIPEPPKDFPYTLDGGLDMTPGEAQWLRERMVENSRDTLLEHILLTDEPPSQTAVPWEDRECLSAPDAVLKDLRIAQGFAVMMNGAALLYNLLVARRYEEEGFTHVSDPVATYEQRYAQWLERTEAIAPQLHAWSVDDLWTVTAGAHVTPWTRNFIEFWTGSVKNGAVQRALSADGTELVRRVAERERVLKKTQARLTNTKLLGAWSGASGVGELAFRWPQVRGIVTDIHDGLSRA